ncbi:MAG: GAF domain-containing protein [Anaerolineaceae bacterium]|nr:GAF domain-containing protein [Anaerolineaceae bacterium]
MAQSQEQILVVVSDGQVSFLLDRVLKSMGYDVQVITDRASALKSLDMHIPALVVVGEKLNDISGLDFAADLLRRNPSMPIILFVQHDSPEMLKSAMRLGVNEYLTMPLRTEDVTRAVKGTLELAKLRRDATILESRRATQNLQRRLDELETLERLGRTITSSLDLDSVLSTIVDAAVELTGAEEGSLLLLDEETGDLYMRASRNFQDEFVRTFRLPIKDTLAGSVIRSGQPVLLDENTPQKIKTSYLVQSLLYVPLSVGGRTFGVMGVDNRSNRMPFTNHHLKLLSALAEFAVIALENSRLYTDRITEHKRLEAILTGVRDGVVVIDQEHRLTLVNEVVREALQLGEENLMGRPFREVFNQPALLDLLEGFGKSASNRSELTVEDGRVFNALISPIPQVGIVFTLSDITNLKKLDRIKTDFVNTVSHDLRSPLTAILGYVELVERAGSINDLQRDFIRRVQVSVHNITSLVDDLLDLGRIESGFDSRKEALLLDQIIQYSVDVFKKRIAEKGHKLEIDLPTPYPPLYGNPVQMRQMVDHMLENAIKYTPSEGTIKISSQVEEHQVIIQFSDSGQGIPALDLPYIFDKFYRASNATGDVSGTGLGLAIVKSIVENHDGRIWVDSQPGKGTTFTIVLPVRGG